MNEFALMACKTLGKILSGRYFATVVIISTLCLGYMKCMDLVVLGKMSIETFLGINTGFSTLTGSIVTFYFTKGDRTNGEDKK